MSEHLGCNIVIKEKGREFYIEDEFRKSMKDYKNLVSVVDYCDDDNKLIADSSVVIGSTSTIMFKSIQMGVPTIVLDKFGHMGNFYNYDGLIKTPSYGKIVKSIKYQNDRGRSEEFIKTVLSGGWEFNSIDLYIDSIKEILKV